MGKDYKRKKPNSGRDAGGFAAIPWSVLDSTAYAHLSHPAKSLLMEFSRQFIRDNNGKLLCSMAYLRPRGWKSADVVQRAKSELLAAGFIFETCKGHRPNKASWYAVTWQALDRHNGYDIGAIELFVRSAYRKNAPLIPPNGMRKTPIVPLAGVPPHLAIPPHGAIKVTLPDVSIPANGNHLDKPSDDSFSMTQPTAHDLLEMALEVRRPPSPTQTSQMI